MTTDPPEPRYERFTVIYPSGTVINSVWCLEGGGTLRAVQVEHPMAQVTPVENSRVHIEDAP
jgi:hypothetical protein